MMSRNNFLQLCCNEHYKIDAKNQRASLQYKFYHIYIHSHTDVLTCMSKKAELRQKK